MTVAVRGVVALAALIAAGVLVWKFDLLKFLRAKGETPPPDTEPPPPANAESPRVSIVEPKEGVSLNANSVWAVGTAQPNELTNAAIERVAVKIERQNFGSTGRKTVFEKDVNPDAGGNWDAYAAGPYENGGYKITATAFDVKGKGKMVGREFSFQLVAPPPTKAGPYTSQEIENMLMSDSKLKSLVTSIRTYTNIDVLRFYGSGQYKLVDFANPLISLYSYPEHDAIIQTARQRILDLGFQLPKMVINYSK